MVCLHLWKKQRHLHLLSTPPMFPSAAEMSSIRLEEIRENRPQVFGAVRWNHFEFHDDIPGDLFPWMILQWLFEELLPTGRGEEQSKQEIDKPHSQGSSTPPSRTIADKEQPSGFVACSVQISKLSWGMNLKAFSAPESYCLSNSWAQHTVDLLCPEEEKHLPGVPRNAFYKNTWCWIFIFCQINKIVFSRRCLINQQNGLRECSSLWKLQTYEVTSGTEHKTWHLLNMNGRSSHQQ